MDGQPVEGAAVTFISEDGNRSYTGSTDASGTFSLSSANEVGALPGKYKVVVIEQGRSGLEIQLKPQGKVSEKEEEARGQNGREGRAGLTDPTKGKTGGRGRGEARSGPVGGWGRPGTGSIQHSLGDSPRSMRGSTSPLTAKVPPDGELRIEA